MSRSVTAQKTDALQTVIYEGPVISGPPIKWGQIEKAMRKAFKTRSCAACGKDLSDAKAVWVIRGVDHCTDCGSGME